MKTGKYILQEDTYFPFLSMVIERGIQAATQDYSAPAQKQELEGAIAGFRACYNKQPDELISIYNEVNSYLQEARNHDDKDTYFYFRCYQAEIEWITNVVSAYLNLLHGKEALFSWQPTVRAMQLTITVLDSLSNK